MAAPKGSPKRGGRIKGTPNKSTADIKAAAQKHGAAMLAELVRIAQTSRSDQARVAAADKVLDRAYGKAPQAITGANGGPILGAIANVTDPIEAAKMYQRMMGES